MANTNQIVQKLWNLCDILRDGGVDYMGYVNELTFILFPKMLEEKGLDKKWLPNGFRWKDLSDKNGTDQFDFYRQMLLELGTAKSKLKKHPRVLEIYANANTSLKQPKHLSLIVSEINKIEWYSHDKDDLGDMYEGLLEKVGTEKKSGAGQYFTPRPLIESIVDVLQPQAKEEIQDPAAGTCGFLIYADKYIKQRTDNLAKLSESGAEFQIKDAFYGVELVEVTHRLALMNLMLHDMESNLIQGSSLGEAGANLKSADLILTNPPFGNAKGDGGSTRSDLTYETANKQLSFLQHIYRSLKVGGRAGVVLPDNVLFESGAGAKIRQDLMDKCNLHTILRLPAGIFYAQGIKTNVLFFNKGKKETSNTKEIWVYDLRANMPSFGKTSPLNREHFTEFENAYGKKSDGSSKRTDQGETGRFRCFSIDEIKKRDYNLDISWLRDESVTHADDFPEPEEILIKMSESISTAHTLLKQAMNELTGKTHKGKNWERKTLREVTTLITKGTTPTSIGFDFKKSGIPFIKIESLKNGEIDPRLVQNFIDLETHEALKRSQLCENDILFSIAGTIGRSAIVKKKDIPANCNQAVAIIRGYEEKLNPDFLLLQLQSHIVQSAASGKKRGGALQNISLGDISGFEVVIPPLKEQNEISKRIRSTLGKLASSVDELNKSLSDSNILKQAILKKAFEGEW